MVEALQDNAYFCYWYIGVTMQLCTITPPYECNVIGGFFELKWLLEFSFSANTLKNFKITVVNTFLLYLILNPIVYSRSHISYSVIQGSHLNHL